ncbi:MAG: hypothetical protein LBS72_04815 [Oscillospiraceae bacterium]|nr:hypothetical protein [Oscillospiraceae bacterium]
MSINETYPERIKNNDSPDRLREVCSIASTDKFDDTPTSAQTNSFPASITPIPKKVGIAPPYAVKARKNKPPIKPPSYIPNESNTANRSGRGAERAYPGAASLAPSPSEEASEFSIWQAERFAQLWMNSNSPSKAKLDQSAAAAQSAQSQENTPARAVSNAAPPWFVPPISQSQATPISPSNHAPAEQTLPPWLVAHNKPPIVQPIWKPTVTPVQQAQQPPAEQAPPWLVSHNKPPIVQPVQGAMVTQVQQTGWHSAEQEPPWLPPHNEPQAHPSVLTPTVTPIEQPYEAVDAATPPPWFIPPSVQPTEAAADQTDAPPTSQYHGGDRSYAPTTHTPWYMPPIYQPAEAAADQTDAPPTPQYHGGGRNYAPTTYTPWFMPPIYQPSEERASAQAVETSSENGDASSETTIPEDKVTPWFALPYDAANEELIFPDVEPSSEPTDENAAPLESGAPDAVNEELVFQDGEPSSEPTDENAAPQESDAPESPPSTPSLHDESDISAYPQPLLPPMLPTDRPPFTPPLPPILPPYTPYPPYYPPYPTYPMPNPPPSPTCPEPPPCPTCPEPSPCPACPEPPPCPTCPEPPPCPACPEPCQPIFPPELTMEECCVAMIASIAAEGYALSHIMNAEGEKIQWIVQQAKTIDELMTVNESARHMVVDITALEQKLLDKLERASNICSSSTGSTISGAFDIECPPPKYEKKPRAAAAPQLFDYAQPVPRNTRDCQPGTYIEPRIEEAPLLEQARPVEEEPTFDPLPPINSDTITIQMSLIDAPTIEPPSDTAAYKRIRRAVRFAEQSQKICD